MTGDDPFWRRKSLDEMSAAEWESLCDGCARCCLIKYGDQGCDEIEYTDVACRLLDHATCRCTNYANRRAIVHDCVDLTPREVRNLGWLPSTCAYRLIDEGKDLAWWHPLVSGDPETVHQAGISVRGRIVAEHSGADPEDRIVDWPV